MSAEEPQKETIGFFQVSFPIKHRHQKKTWWMRIGSATLRSDRSVLGSIEAIPMKWNGSFYLFPVEKEATDAR
jgi:hypothetical protein